MENRERSIGFLFNDISRMRVTLYDRFVAPLGLTFTQAMLLHHLMVRDGATQVELARRMDLGTVTISGVIDRLEAAGWVVRKPDERDRRAKTVWKTEAANAIRSDLVTALKSLNDLTLHGLTDSQIAELSTLLRQARASLAQALAAPGKD
ncbi:MarR family winged helix-turn-helix transcriptional regulator [Paracoccus sp. (in: a-proteobacteria)]|uniref:MarR family winged helix-turn-helix transcriptional regulator n=1 Tax=Paracoccus sp. TaxID=267 RepID=UPI003A8A7C39